MRIGRLTAWRPHPMVVAIAATLCAAALVLYFQHRALSAHEAQARVILKQVSEQTASDIATEVRRTLDGPVFDTLTAVNHPDLRAGRLGLVARQFHEGLEAYPHVERFLVWTAETEAVAPGEALFLGRRQTGQPIRAGLRDGAGFQRDAALGRAVVDLARRHVRDQHIYVAAENVGPSGQHMFLRLFWTDARRVEYFAVLGFVVDPAMLRDRFFAALHDRGLGALLNRRGGGAPLHLRVVDDQDTVVYRQGTAADPAVAAVTVPMQFYPVDRIDSRLTSRVPPRLWRIEVAPPPGRLFEAGPSYWPTALSIVLMAVAIGLTVQASRRAADLTRMQTDFISHVSHQLKTPLSLLSAATETVTMDRVRSPEKLAQYLDIIRGEVTRLSALVQRILEFSRLQQARGYERELVDLGTLVHETVAAFETSLAGQHFTFAVDESGPAPCVMADPAAIEQALVNLLDNAVKYSEAVRHVRVRLASSGAEAVIEVIDQGPGIAPADRTRIFEKFYRGGGPSAHKSGFGLGLPIVQELVRAHGGRVEVVSAPGEGSTFRIVLPSARGNRVESPGRLDDAARRQEAAS